MAQFLDYRSSENSNAPGSPGTDLSTDSAAPTFIGDIGLIVGIALNTRVDLWATVGLTTTGTVTTRFLIARNLNPTSTFVAANVIYTGDVAFLSDDVGPHIVSLDAADLAGSPGPIPQQINYSLFAFNATDDETVVTRSGPEVFTGMAVTG